MKKKLFLNLEKTTEKKGIFEPWNSNWKTSYFWTLNNWKKSLLKKLVFFSTEAVQKVEMLHKSCSFKANDFLKLIPLKWCLCKSLRYTSSSKHYNLKNKVAFTCYNASLVSNKKCAFHREFSIFKMFWNWFDAIPYFFIHCKIISKHNSWSPIETSKHIIMIIALWSARFLCNA